MAAHENSDGTIRPRLAFTNDGHARAGTVAADGGQQEIVLDVDEIHLGSDPANDIVLDGLSPDHAVLVRQEGDEWVFTPSDISFQAQTSLVNGAAVPRAALHHGDRLDLAGHVLTFQRAEAAEHIRPDGGREGGDFAGGASAAGGGDAGEPAATPDI